MDKPLDATTEIHQQFPPQWSVSSGIHNIQAPDLLALPDSMMDLPEWLRLPLRRFLRLKQRNWPAKTVQRSTRQLFSRLNYMIEFFIQNYKWSEGASLARVGLKITSMPGSVRVKNLVRSIGISTI